MTHLRGRPEAIGWIVLMITTACGPTEEPLDTAVVRDSMGVRIVESSAPQWLEEERWSISAEPFLTVGNRSGEPPLSRVVGATRLADGRIVVGDAGGPTVLYFASTGELEMEVGGSGEGPGEFRGLTSVRPFRSDSVMAHDFQNRRVSVFSPDGAYARGIPVAEFIHGSMYEPLTLTPEGSMIWRPFLFAAAQNEETGWLDYPILRSGPEGGELDTISWLPIRYQIVEGGRRIAQGIGTWGSLEWGPMGLDWARTDRPEIHRFTYDGQLTEIVRWEAEPIPLTPELREAIIDEQVQSAISNSGGDASGMPETEVRSRFEDRRYEDFVPPMSEIRVDATGAIWSRGRDLPDRDTGRTWQIFHRDGPWLGEVVAPERLTIFEIGSDYVLGVELDAFDVPTVMLYELIKGSE